MRNIKTFICRFFLLLLGAWRTYEVVNAKVFGRETDRSNMAVPTSISASDVIYLDNNATTPLAPEVLHAINSSAANAFANPSSSSLIGRAAKKLIIESRAEIAQMINADPFDIIFTSGGTEANNWVIYSVLKYYYTENGKDSSDSRPKNGLKLPHIVTTEVEHDAVLEPIKRLVDEKKLEATFVPVEKKTGSVRVEKVLACLRNETILVSIMLANNETGAIFPVSEIMSKCREWVKEKRPEGLPLFGHTDAAQCIGKMRVDVEKLGVDYLTIVGHKFYGPRIGALYAKSPGQKTPLAPMFFGGGQERGFRSGTENTPMIVGLGAAARLVNLNLESYISHMSEIKKYLIAKLKQSFPSDCLHFNHPYVDDDSLCLVNTVNVGFYKSDWILFTGSALLNNMNRVVTSTGAACHAMSQGSGVTKPSRILTDVGVRNDVAIRSLRISVGRQTTKAEIDETVVQLYNAVCLGAQTKI